MRNPFGDRSLIESVYSLFKLKYSSTTSNPINRSERYRRSMACWKLTIKLFTLPLQPHEEVKLSYYVSIRKRKILLARDS